MIHHHGPVHHLEHFDLNELESHAIQHSINPRNLNPSTAQPLPSTHNGQPSKPQWQVRPPTADNIFKKPLALHSTSPMTGFLRDGYCHVPAGDFGNHAVAASVSKEFLDFTASRGNDLRSAGLTPGCKWCLCASRWKEAFLARKNDTDPVVPKVWLNATNEKALGKVELEELKKFAADKEE
ncbi:hypothetical protein EJ05DRAFT_500097 [Pseudovirgaria hyperparasitica]|uniref:Uncharacterized protein n=1 Tax=Pseudovirgaria hyperparasitica TaxID=470096 RepID=A0A6A6W9G0_9PEZI|nr:uncharacterized protein EJ05DRAFT_500097 [Pseudovirgaria hyperparasitica]KAF2758580.1 hypothetical protein EJ05DRAFT_500097 [Pseudovirgaria hyperparasitica]